MKIIFTYLILASVNLFTFFSQKKFAEISTCTLINNFCSLDLSTSINGLKLDSAIDISYGLTTGLSTDVLYQKNPCPPNDNAPPTSCTDGYDAMKYDVYFPDSLNNKIISYSECGLPAIIMFHGGSFDECSDKGNPGIKYVCRQMALRGFIVFNVEYRRGVLIDQRIPLAEQNNDYPYNNLSAQQLLAIYRGAQDVRGAVRSIIHRQLTSTNGDRFEVDESRLFLGGISAGSLIAMNAAYFERQSQIDSSLPGVSAVLGDIDQEYYIGDSDIDFLPSIKGVLNMWGAIPMHKGLLPNPENFFSGNAYTPPIISFQGQLDNVFPVRKEKLYFSPDSVPGKNFNIERNCLVYGSQFQIDDDLPTPHHDLCGIGADGIYTAFKIIGKSVELYLDCEMYHGPDDDCGTCTFNSNFGTAAMNQNQLYDYIASRATTYFVAILYNKVKKLDLSRFIECENQRVECDTTDQSNCPYSYSGEAGYDCNDYENQ